MMSKDTLKPQDYTKMTQQQRRALRLRYIEHQEGRCAHCDEPLDGPPAHGVLTRKFTARLFPEGFLNHPVHLHHCHATGMTIGAVHARCNADLWEHHGA